MLANQSTADIIANTLRSEITLGRIPRGARCVRKNWQSGSP